MGQIKILAFAGSLRSGSFNKKLLLQVCDQLKETGCEVSYLDLKSLQLPIYDGDLEDSEGMPAGGQKLIESIVAADAIVIASPEYNSSISGALKNAIDWASRASKNPFNGKVIGLVGTSTGWFGAVRSLTQLRLILNHLRAVVIPAQVTIPNAEESFNAQGKLNSESHSKLIKSMVGELVSFAKAHKQTP